MARMPRKPERCDFSALLKELQSENVIEKPAPSIISPSKKDNFPHPKVSPEKRKRDSLMSNPKMRYAYSDTERVLHDRDCISVQKIPDREFRMIETFLSEMPFCTKCYRKGLVRAAITDDFKRLNAYFNVFNLMKAPAADLHKLIIENRAQLFDVGLDYIGIKVHEDKWYISVQKERNFLYHNNYQVYGDYERLFEDGYHLQPDGGIHSFHNFVKVMTHYNWASKVEGIKLRLQNERRVKFRKDLESIPNVVRQNRPLSLFAHYTFIDCKNKSRRYFSRNGIQPRIYEIKEIPSTPFSVVSCKVWRWWNKPFLAAMDSLKDYAANTEHFDYDLHCKAQITSE